MVFHKRLDYGSNDRCQVPQILLPKSAKGKRSARQKLQVKSNISAFDLLATVAGELLSEQENSPPPIKIIKQEKLDSEIPFKAEDVDQGSCDESTFHSETVFKAQTPSIEKIGGGLIVDGKRNENAIDENVPMDLDLDAKPPPLVSSDSSVEVPISCNGSFAKSRDDMGLLVHGDDDESSSGCTHPNTNTTKSFRGDRRISMILASKFMKAPRTLKDGELTNADVELRPIYRNRKMCYTRRRTQKSPFKRRKSFERHSITLPSNGSIYSEGGINIVANANGETGASSSSHEKSSYESGDYHVKLNIKSFKVPELFIEIPETATVGSLKRTVMEAVTAILAGGLRVGVLLQGKKIRDDKQTLVQAGIAHSNKIENLGFSLEPNCTQAPLPSLTTPEDPNPLLPSNPQLACASIEPVESVLYQVPPKAEPEPFQTSTLIGPESNHDSVHSHTDASSSVDKASDSKALVPAPGTKPDTLPAVPLRKSRQSEFVQRRIRRPFSVTEVEALVHAVEKLGTGRWRDVKIRAFDNAKHRTYVDLKDKWKTLVHTATISPQQRRGEPVPQQLLDRVLAAHSYWTHQQAKPSQLEPCF